MTAAMPSPPLMEEHLKRLACSNAHDSTDSTPQSTPTASDGPSADTVLMGPSTLKKSAKRKSAEALLASKYDKLRRVSSTQSLGVCGAGSASPCCAHPTSQQPTAAAPGSSRPSVAVPACRSCGTGRSGWCAGAVSIPPMNWPTALQPLASDDDLVVDSTGLYTLPGSITVRIVTRPEQMPGALRALRESMADGFVAIDLEWRPDGYMNAGGGATAPPTRVALMQLASATMCVLVRTCRMPTLPPSLVSFLSDTSITLVGYSWDNSDQAKMVGSYGWGRERFGAFHDLQTISEALGYHGYGLGALTRQLLGFEPPKSRKVTMSNWEAWQLSSSQIQYAALDAIITGHIYRGLRLWHASPSACASCRQDLGAALPKPSWCCKTCSRNFDSLSGAQSHVRSKQHVPSWQQCHECGRVGCASGA